MKIINKAFNLVGKLLKGLIKVNPNERITCKEILELPFLRQKGKKIRDFEIE